MPVDPVSVSGRVIWMIQRGKTRSSLPSTGISPNVTTVTPSTHAFVASPEIVTAFAIAGDLTFNPLTDTLTNEDGVEVMLDEPQGIELPIQGFAVEDAGYQAPAEDGIGVQVLVVPTSDRLAIARSVSKLGKVQTSKV